ncbi:allantoicase [Reinekea forsetii]|uniref:Probable allantoicase n=1 Tax=Reinekea forsetii TaxID=1336806 RepID=A0A2K8KNX6_9GAMM|nr:allantoicase [Reinekea forsetii]ATX76485.1 allantoicase [Reinekea forsetii]MDO7640373.1 allantoicase [Reinekea forsetii]
MNQAQNLLHGPEAELDAQFKVRWVDLASERVGGETLACSDDFFAEMENLLKAGRGVFIDDKFTERGKWMDGWESRRSYGRPGARSPETDFDWCIIRLGMAGVIRGFDIDTNYFRGNAPQAVVIEACHSAGQPNADTLWQTLLSKTDVRAHSQNVVAIDDERVFTHVRLKMYPDGGIARFRVYGEVAVDWHDFVDGELIDLASIKNGGQALLVSDMFYSDKNNLIMPERGKNMGDGWETRRRRDPGPDWSIIQLATLGSVEKVLVDTCHFKGNYPDTFSLEGATASDDPLAVAALRTDPAALQALDWLPIIGQTKLYAHREHLFIREILVPKEQAFSHIRLSIYPDGGVSRLRVFGKRQALA